MNELSNQSNEPVPAKTSEPAKGMAIASWYVVCVVLYYFIPFANIVFAIVGINGHIHLSNMKKFPDMY